MIEMIGVPLDVTGRARGSAMGPDALRYAELGDYLRSVGHEVRDHGNLAFPTSPTLGQGLRHFDEAMDLLIQLRDTVSEMLNAGSIPVVLGGDHTLSMGSVAAALQKHDSDLAVLWIDAHADINTPATTPSGNMHGMPVGALLGLPAVGGDAVEVAQWGRLLGEFATSPLQPNRMAWIGLRDVDSGERQAIRNLPDSFPSVMHDVDRYGLERVMSGFEQWMLRSGTKNLWVSFDIDSLDPVVASGAGTPVRGGLTYREAHLLAELLYEMQVRNGWNLVGLDVVEVNPMLDHANTTAAAAVEWVGSLLGKSTLGGWKPLEF